jgi:hypothetical protein
MVPLCDIVNEYIEHLSSKKVNTQLSKVRAKLVCRDNNPEVMAHALSVQNASKRKFTTFCTDEKVSKQMKFDNEHCKNRMEAADKFTDCEAWTLFALLTTVESKENGNGCKKCTAPPGAHGYGQAMICVHIQ